MPRALERLIALGQSPWIDYLSRALLESGRLDELVRDGWVTGLTSNPSIFRKAIVEGDDYRDQLRAIAARGADGPYAAFVELAMTDIRCATDALRPVHEGSGGADGFVSLELPPALAEDAEASVEEAVRLARLAERANLMIKVPATEAGVAALSRLVALGVNVNVTLLFSVDRYRQVAEAYLEGLERRLHDDEPLDAVHSVASFFVSRVDSAIDPRLPEGSPLRGTAAIANALAAYRGFEAIHAGERWERLASAGARPQRLLWGSTSAKNPKYRDVKYVEGLILPQTVNTMPEPTLLAFADHGRARALTAGERDVAAGALDALAVAGIDLEAVCAQLLRDGLQAFADDFDALLADIETRLAEARAA